LTERKRMLEMQADVITRYSKASSDIGVLKEAQLACLESLPPANDQEEDRDEDSHEPEGKHKQPILTKGRKRKRGQSMGSKSDIDIRTNTTSSTPTSPTPVLCISSSDTPSPTLSSPLAKPKKSKLLNTGLNGEKWDLSLLPPKRRRTLRSTQRTFVEQEEEHEENQKQKITTSPKVFPSSSPPKRNCTTKHSNIYGNSRTGAHFCADCKRQVWRCAFPNCHKWSRKQKCSYHEKQGKPKIEVHEQQQDPGEDQEDGESEEVEIESEEPLGFPSDDDKQSDDNSRDVWEKDFSDYDGQAFNM